MKWSRISFGVRVPVEGWVPITTHPPDFNYFVRLARVAESLGYDSLFTSDHLLNWIGSTPGKTAPDECLALKTYESWTTISTLATSTKKMKLSNIVLCNAFRNPALLAKMTTTLDLISNGRVVLSIGAGWFKEECSRYGFEWFPYKERIERLRESICVIKALWMLERANFEGRYYKLRNAVMEPKPVTKPHPPIWLGGTSDDIMRITAEEGDGWDLTGSPETVKAKVNSLHEFCDKIDRKPRSIIISHSCMVVFCRTKRESVQLVKRKAKDLNTTVDEFMEKHIVGSPSEIADRLNEYLDSGVRHFTLYFDRDMRNLRKFASDVIPDVA